MLSHNGMTFVFGQRERKVFYFDLGWFVSVEKKVYFCYMV